LHAATAFSGDLFGVPGYQRLAAWLREEEKKKKKENTSFVSAMVGVKALCRLIDCAYKASASKVGI
jgi:hypothetical protein